MTSKKRKTTGILKSILVTYHLSLVSYRKLEGNPPRRAEAVIEPDKQVGDLV